MTKWWDREREELEARLEAAGEHILAARRETDAERKRHDLTKRELQDKKIELQNALESCAKLEKLLLEERLSTHEEYLLIIDEICATWPEARTIDIARKRGVSHVTVIKALQGLKRAGLIRQAPYRGAFLTDRGKEHVAEVRSRRFDLRTMNMTGNA